MQIAHIFACLCMRVCVCVYVYVCMYVCRYAHHIYTPGATSSSCHLALTECHSGHVPSEHTSPAPDRDQNIDDKTHKKHNIHKTEKTHTTHKKHNIDNTGKTHKTHKKETVVRYIGF